MTHSNSERAFEEIAYHVLQRIRELTIPEKSDVSRRMKVLGTSLERKYNEELGHELAQV